MKLLICIDDTDNLESKGTGEIADELKGIIRERGFGYCGLTTRHQFLIHEDIPYTSHNSAMCFDCTVDERDIFRMIPVLYDHLQAESAPDSDPGIAAAKLDGSLDTAVLLDFGMKAKRVVLTKEQAYETAGKAKVYLAEVGGSGQGVIGALGGIGLRLGGNDGDVKGRITEFKQNNMYTVADLLENENIQAVCDTSGHSIGNDSKVLIAWKAKPLLANHRFVLVVKQLEPGLWTTMSKSEMRSFGDQRLQSAICERYSPDVEEEQVAAPLQSCPNCRFRRWLKDGFLCAVRENDSGF